MAVKSTTLPEYGIRISYKFLDFDVPEWDTRDWMHPHYKITIKHAGKQATFDFWGSYKDYQEGKEDLSTKDLMWVGELIFGEARMGLYDFDEFVDEFGIEDPKEAYRSWKALQARTAKLSELGFDTEDELMEIQEEFREAAEAWE